MPAPPAPRLAKGAKAAASRSSGGRRYKLNKYAAPVVAKGKFYPTEDVKKPAKRAFKPTVAKLRASITPGTVVILLAGRFKGRRAVVLGQFKKSGLLLVTGPYEHNGVPLRRVNASYVIATSTKVDVSKVQDINTIDEAAFSAKAEKKEKDVGKSADKFAQLQATGKKSGAPSAERAELQKKVDGAIVLSKDKKEAEEVAKYLKSRFSLTNNDKPHAMKF